MKEQLISFEIAKLAKEKRFPHGDGVSAYDEDGDIVNSHIKVAKYSAPTQSLLQKWLREEKGTPVIILKLRFSEHYYPEIHTIHKIIDFSAYIYHKKTYEKALEEGLKEALKITKP